MPAALGAPCACRPLVRSGAGVRPTHAAGIAARPPHACRRRCATISAAAADTSFDAADPLSPSPDPVVRKAGACYGCGAPLQTHTPSSAGYVDPAAATAKATHRQAGLLLCARCRGLAQGDLQPGVREDWWGGGPGPGPPEPGGGPPGGGGGAAPPPRRLATPAQLRAELADVASGPALIALIVDVLDVPGSLLGRRVRGLVGKNPVFLVGTRADLLPRTLVGRGPGGPSGSRPGPRALAAWLADTAARRGLTVAGAAACSSKTGAGVGAAVGALRRARRGRDLVVLGAANVGKSAFVRAFVKETKAMGSPHYDPAAAAVGRRLPLEAAVPGTTLRRIALRAFASGGGALVDTPGLHLHHRLVHCLAPGDVAALQPTRALRPWFGTDPALVGTDGAGMGAASYVWGGLARVDVRGAPPGARLVFYGPPALRVGAAPLTPGPLDGATVDALAGGTGAGGAPTPAFGAAAVAARGGLRPARAAALRGRAVDVAVSGLPGWLAIRPPAGDTGPDALAGMEIRVWAPVGVEVFLRDPLPAAEEAEAEADVWV